MKFSNAPACAVLAWSRLIWTRCSRRIVRNYAHAGYECVAERHLGLRDNFSFSEVSADSLRAKVREVAQAKPDAIAIFCTNLRGAPLVEELEAEIGIPIYDTIATAVWKALRMAGVDTTPVRAWGKLFQSPRV